MPVISEVGGEDSQEKESEGSRTGRGRGSAGMWVQLALAPAQSHRELGGVNYILWSVPT